MGITVWEQETTWGGDSWNSCVESIYTEGKPLRTVVDFISLIFFSVLCCISFPYIRDLTFNKNLFSRIFRYEWHNGKLCRVGAGQDIQATLWQ